MSRWSRVGLAAMLLAFGSAVAGCDGGGSAEKTAGEQPAKTGEQADAKADSVAGDAPAVTSVRPPATDLTGRLLAWIDPDAHGVIYAKMPRDLDLEAIATLFAVPSKGERILRQMASADENFEMLLGEGAADEWFEAPALAMLPVIAQGAYIVRLLKKPAESFEAALTGADMELREIEGLKVFVPRGGFPWKIVLLEDNAVGFVPVRELGSGIGPLTAARDLPPSDVETQLSAALHQDPDTILELLVQGPMGHMAIAEPLISVRLSLRSYQTTGVDGVVALQPTGDLDGAVNSLRARSGELETDQMKALMDRVAFQIEGPIITGRLQIPSADRAALEREP